MSKYEYKCNSCNKIYWFDRGQTYKNCTKCEWKGELRLKSIQHDDFNEEDKNPVQELVDKAVANPNDDTGEEIVKATEDEEPEMPEGGWECSECGAPVDNMNDVCSRSCFNSMMR